MDFPQAFSGGRRRGGPPILAAIVIVGGLLVAIPAVVYTVCRIEVPSRSMAILIKKTGKDLGNEDEIAPSIEYKGLQKEVLAEGRHFRNPWNWRWEVVPQVEIPQDKLGVRIRLYGDDLPYGHVIAWEENQKGIVPDVLRPGRYAINALVEGHARRTADNYAEHVELHDPVVIPAGFKGVVTNLSSPMPDDPNQLLVEAGKRGAQEQTLDEGTYYINPYVTRINLIDCRSQRFNLGVDGEMGFPSKDGFWVTLDGIIEFRVMPDKAAHVFVIYNESANDNGNDARIEEELIKKVIVPNARAFCRLRGSDHSGKEFISGDTRIKFQEDFQKELEQTCESQGIEIIQALITRIYPPQKIAEPVRERQIAVQEETQYEKQMQQQESEQQLAIERSMVERKRKLVEAEREVVKVVTEAEQKQEVAIIEANQRLKVAELELQAAEDLAAAVTARGKADADVIEFQNQAEAAGWKKAVSAFSGDGDQYARWVMLKKLAPSFQQMMVNTADSPLMDIFRQFSEPPAGARVAQPLPPTASAPLPDVGPVEP
ncbi:MAG: band 7 protein [Pirellulaceae bacterium]|nr:band 7 protein [Pirellulaceae bacterium]